MPWYVCPKCGRAVEKPLGKYYCTVCGPSVIMVRVAGENNPNVERSFEKCFREVWTLLAPDPKVIEILKKSGPAYPSSPRYNYADLVEHMRYSILALCICDPERLPEYHLPEIFDRRRKLNDQLNELEMTRVISLEERTYIENHLRELTRKWEREFKRRIKELCTK